MNTLTLTNRSDSAITPEWIHIVPRGELWNAEAGLMQVLDDEAIKSILANINSDRARQGSKWAGIYLGKEHHCLNPQLDSVAMGWFKNFKVDADGLWGSTDGLTPLGKQAVADKLYKYTSFTAHRDDVQPLDGNRVRILAIHNVGLTNNPNGAELLTPISNREAGSPKPAAGSQQPPAAHPLPAGEGRGEGEKQHQPAAPELSNRLPDPAALPHPNPLPLGEGTAVTTTATLSVSQPQPPTNNMELEALKNRATALEAENATLKTENTTLKNRLQETESEQIAGLLDQHGVKSEPARAALLPVLLELRNRAERVQWLANVLPPAAAQAPAPSAPAAPAKPLTNRAAAAIPDIAPGAKHKPADELEKRVREMMVQNRCNYAEAFRLCKTKHAELLAQS